MNDNAIISIKGNQFYDGMEQEGMELVTSGMLLAENNGFTISYEESELTGMEGTTTRLRIEGPRVTMLREGNVNSQMIFEEGQKHLSMYETPYGSLAIGIDTRRMRNTVNESGGDLEIDYAIEIDNSLAGKNLFRISVKKAPGIPQ